jgi:hypothetical protein
MSIYQYIHGSGIKRVWLVHLYLTAPRKNDKYPGISYVNYCGIAPPEFPALALPVVMMIGMVGIIYGIKKREN